MSFTIWQDHTKLNANQPTNETNDDGVKHLKIKKEPLVSQIPKVPTLSSLALKATTNTSMTALSLSATTASLSSIVKQEKTKQANLEEQVEVNAIKANLK